MAAGSTTHKLLIAILLLASFSIGALSVTGLLQSTEILGSSGIAVVPAPPPAIPGAPYTPPSPPPPEPTVEIDIYSDQACTQTLSNIAWGQVEAGASATATMYVKNSGETGVTLSLDTRNWTPSNAPNYMTLTWNYDGTSITPGQIKQITLTLTLSSSCPPMSGFSFNIIIIGS